MHATATDREVSRVSLWFGLFGGAVAWTIHLMLAYAIAEFGCVGGLNERNYWNISLVAWLELAATAASSLLAVAATALAYRSQVRVLSSPPTRGVGSEVEQYTARAGFFTSGIFSFVILFESIPIFFYLRSC
jgi:hypothetical protein